MEDLKTRAQKIIEKLDVTGKKKRIRELEIESESPSFWQEHKTAAVKMKELSGLQKEVEEAEVLQLMVDEQDFNSAEEIINKLDML